MDKLKFEAQNRMYSYTKSISPQPQKLAQIKSENA